MAVVIRKNEVEPLIEAILSIRHSGELILDLDPLLQRLYEVA
jgi:hypothetical protein